MYYKKDEKVLNLVFGKGIKQEFGNLERGNWTFEQ